MLGCRQSAGKGSEPVGKIMHLFIRCSNIAARQRHLQKNELQPGNSSDALGIQKTHTLGGSPRQDDFVRRTELFIASALSPMRSRSHLSIGERMVESLVPTSVSSTSYRLASSTFKASTSIRYLNLVWARLVAFPRSLT